MKIGEILQGIDEIIKLERIDDWGTCHCSIWLGWEVGGWSETTRRYRNEELSDYTPCPDPSIFTPHYFNRLEVI